MSDPDVIDKVIAALATMTAAEQVKVTAEMPVDFATEMRKRVRGKLAAYDTFDGFRHTFYCLTNHELPKHSYKWYPVLQGAYLEAQSSGFSGAVLKAFRGSIKSMFSSIFFQHKLGMNPHKSGLIVQAREEDAKTTSGFLAMLMGSAGWKNCFPNVVPDEQRGWAMGGYFIKDTSIQYDDFLKKTTEDHGRHPSFVAVPISSGAIGMHPTLMTNLDDIHDSRNTASDVVMADVANKFFSDILPAPNFSPINFVGTPWKENDTYAQAEKAPAFKRISTPAFTFDEQGKDDWYGQPITLTWPEVFTVQRLQSLYEVNKREFRRMYLLDLTNDKGDRLLFTTYPEELIDRSWPMVGGVDPSAIFADRQNDMKRQSYFAMAYTAKLPEGGAVVTDGIVDQCSIDRGVQHILDAQSAYPRWITTIVEGVGFGLMWYQQAALHPEARIRKGNLQGFGFSDVGAKGDKSKRLFNELVPLFENGRVRVSSKNTRFLNLLRHFFDDFYTLDEHDPAWDVADAVYQSLKGMPEVLQVKRPPDGLTNLEKSLRRNPVMGMIQRL